jgi:Xaa-Pro dipeptidase
MLTSIHITEGEFKTRCDRLLEHLREKKLEGVVLFDSFYVLYYTGFAFLPTERPIAFVMNVKGERGLFVPRLEVEHAQANALIDRVEHYLEYPGTDHPMNALLKLLKAMGVTERIGSDSDGYPWIYGYRGPSLTSLTGHAPELVTAFVEDEIRIKSPAEIALIKESIRWGNLAHTLLQRYTRPGLTETYVQMKASMEANLAMLDAIGPIYRAESGMMGNLYADYRGQIGRGAAIPHAMANNVTFRPGDVLVSGASAPVWGYNSELERTMIIGPVSDAQKRLFDHMVAIQDVAFATMGPGVLCADVDRAVQAYYRQHDLMDYWRHHVGHGLGLRIHESPYMDIGDMTPLAPGMVLSVEPGLYVPGVGGFRHSDTALITQDGIELLTYYPRDLESMTI